jgi:DNA-binding response OmpR family regulator
VTEAVTVLIVEDDQLIQGMVEEALSDGGVKSVITGSGEEAVALLQANESIYRAIVTDINLLGTIDGWEVARCAREIDPVLPVIYMTGTNGEDWPSRGLPNSVLLTKPFAPAQLLTAISNLLNAASPHPRRQREAAEVEHANKKRRRRLPRRSSRPERSESRL